MTTIRKRPQPNGALHNAAMRGTWKALRTSRGMSATLVCPGCGLVGLLDEHEIAADGTVRPLVQCPGAGCSFHDTVRLDGWSAA